MSDKVVWEKSPLCVGTQTTYYADLGSYRLVVNKGHGRPQKQPHRMCCDWRVYNGAPGGIALAEGHSNSFERAKRAAEAVARVEVEDAE